MATNPNLIPGNLNRVRASIIVPGNSSLDIPAQFQAKEGLIVAPQTPVVTQMQGLTTIVNSEEPYQLVQFTISVMKSLAISAAYLNQIQNSPILGTVTAVPDTSVMSKFTIYNASIINWNQISMAGLQPDFTLMIQGQWNISNDLWNLL